MEFEWDEAKRPGNIAKHDLDFIAIRNMFDGRPLFHRDVIMGSENRAVSTGLFDGRFCTVVWTRRDYRIRIISARRACDDERRAYRALYRDELEEMARRGEDQTDWARVDARTPEEIEASIDYEDEGVSDLTRVYAGPHSPELLADPANWHESVYLNADIVDWFREHHSDDFRHRLNAILREAMDAERRKAS